MVSRTIIQYLDSLAHDQIYRPIASVSVGEILVDLILSKPI